jgi:hypothetical protein
LLTVPSPISPSHLKRILEIAGYTVATEDEWNWSLIRAGDLPLSLPKEGAFVAVEVMMNVLHQANIVLGAYLPLKTEAAKQLGIFTN